MRNFSTGANEFARSTSPISRSGAPRESWRIRTMSEIRSFGCLKSFSPTFRKKPSARPSHTDPSINFTNLSSGNWHPSEETVDFRLDLNTPVNWRDGQTEPSGVSPCGFRVAQQGFEPEYDLARLAGSALNGMNRMQIASHVGRISKLLPLMRPPESFLPRNLAHMQLQEMQPESRSLPPDPQNERMTLRRPARNSIVVALNVMRVIPPTFRSANPRQTGPPLPRA